MSTREDARKRSELLKHLREQNKETVERTQTLLKEHKKIQQKICQVIRTEAHTVPEIALQSGLPSRDVLWHVTALRKYGQVVETGMCGEYYLYQMTQEKQV
jgi:predicted transcriptional regulator